MSDLRETVARAAAEAHFGIGAWGSMGEAERGYWLHSADAIVALPTYTDFRTLTAFEAGFEHAKAEYVAGVPDGMKLLPCPFCGGEAKLLCRNDRAQHLDYPQQANACVECRCTVSVCADTGGQAVSMWNTRTPATPEPVETAGRREAQSYAEWQQRRGMLADTVDWAVLEYDGYMKDDAYDAQAVLDRIILRLRTTNAALATLPPHAESDTGDPK